MSSALISGTSTAVQQGSVPEVRSWARNRSRGTGTGAAPTRLCRRTSRSEEHTSELQSRENLVCRLLLEKKKIKTYQRIAQKTLTIRAWPYIHEQTLVRTNHE